MNITEFIDFYTKAYQRWYSTQLDPQELIENKAPRLLVSDLLDPGLKEAGLITQLDILVADKAVAYSIKEGSHLQEIWRDEYEDLQEINDEWLKLDAESLKARKLDEDTAFFMDPDDL